MNSEHLLVEAWLKAGVEKIIEPSCPDDTMLNALVGKRLAADEARLMTMHLACCASCRKTVARLVASHAAPSAKPVALRELLSKGGITEAWSDWMRDLVAFLPPEEEEMHSLENDVYEVSSPLRIDDLGRLIVDLAFKQPQPEGAKAALALENSGTRLELSEVTLRRNHLYAVVDLSAFEPRAGILREGVFALEMVAVEAKKHGLLPVLGQIQQERLQGAEFWDRFAPAAAAYGDQMAEVLSQEAVSLDSERTTRVPRVRAGGAAALTEETHLNTKAGDERGSRRFKSYGSEEFTARPNTTPADRVQYALETLEEYAFTWNECNPEELPGIKNFIGQLRAALMFLSGDRTEHSEAPGPTADSAQAEQTIAAPRSRRADAEAMLTKKTLTEKPGS